MEPRLYGSELLGRWREVLVVVADHLYMYRYGAAETEKLDVQSYEKQRGWERKRPALLLCGDAKRHKALVSVLGCSIVVLRVIFGNGIGGF